MLKESATEKLGDSFKKTTVGVYFGNPGETVPDPYLADKARTAPVVNSVAVAWWAVVMGQKILSISITFISPKNTEPG